MRQTVRILLSLVIMAGVTASAQTLGEAARKSKADKPKSASSRVYTNDDMPSVGAVETQPQTEAGAGEENAEKAVKKDASEDDRKKVEAQWRGKVDAQKKKVADLERELDLLDREHKLRAAAFYADAGNRLRNDRQWADDERRYQEDIANRKKQIEEAKAELEDVRERARKAGVTKVLD